MKRKEAMYRINLEDCSAASFTSFSKPYYGSLDEIRELLSTIRDDPQMQGCCTEVLNAFFNLYEKGRRGVMHGFMSAKDVKYLLYKPNYHFDNHLYKYDTLFISYEKPIIPMTYDDSFDWFDGYDYVLDGNAMERFLDLVDQYSDCDTSSIRAEMEKKKAWYKERNGNK